MRILHTGDIHLGELTGPVKDGQNARMLDTINCMMFLADKAKEEQPDVILVAGDLFHKSKLWADQMLKEIAIAGDWLRGLAEVAPTVLLFGTHNHDNMEAFQNIRSMMISNLHIVTNPEILNINTKSGPLQVAAVPGFDKGYFRAKYPGMAPEEENVKCSQLLGDIVLGLGAQVDQSMPSVLMAHYSVAGCEYDNGQTHIFNQNEVTLPTEALAASPFDLVCLGHIHKAQVVPNCGRPTYYCGPLNGLTFNEEGQQKGFWIHDTNSGSEFIKTPYREFLTMEIDFRDAVDLQAEMKWQLAGIGSTQEETLLMFPTVSKIVRCHYKCTEEQRKQISHKEMEKLLYKGGTFYVSEIKPVEVLTSNDREGMNENDGPLENLETWARREKFKEDDIKTLAELARPLIDEVSARVPTGKLSGVFEPKKLSVKNYRSYREEEFDFRKIFFATVNGPNGIGKSAFFMDAICDCLYEQPRSGEVGSWITTDESARSGSITFEFGMGDVDWRVIRTRAKSGKVSLSLQEQVDGQWVDRSASKVRDTQAKIESLLGMDCSTFRCCALIMQDQYGLFMEADKTERMEVLANILGLGIYEQLTELARDKAREVSRSLEVSKSKLAELDEKLKEKPDTEKELADVEGQLQKVAGEIKNKESELREAQELVRQLEAKTEKAKGLFVQIQGIRDEISVREQDIQKRQSQLDMANKMLEAEEKILEKAAERDRVKEQIAVLKTKQPRLTELGNEKNQIYTEIQRVDKQIRRLGQQIRDVDAILANRSGLEKAATEYREAINEDERLNELASQDELLKNKVIEIEKIVDPALEQIESAKQQLKALEDKAEMLENSNCLDPEKATCRFLSDAQQAKAKIPEQKQLIENKEAERKSLMEEIIELENQRKQLGYNSKYHFEVRERIKQLRPKAEQYNQLASKEELKANLQDSKRQAEEQKKSLEERLASVKEWAQQLARELEPLAEMENRLPSLEKWAKAKDDLPAAKQVVVTATETIAQLDRDIKAKEEQVAQLEEERRKILVEISGIESHKENVENIQGHLNSLQTKQNELYSRSGGLKAKLEAFEKDAEERRKVADEITPMAAELIRYQALAKAFGYEGIPFQIVRAVVPELSATANEILSQMTGGRMALDIRLDKTLKSNKKKEVHTLEVWITDWRGNIPYRDRSGGQKVKAALANAFALADLKARRAGIQLGMMFVDEPPFLDSDGIEAYCDALELLSQRYPNMKVIAISHDPRMKARFPQEIDVLETDEGSKIKLTA